MANFLNIDGTQEAAFKIDGPGGPQIKDDSGTFKFRDTGDSADAPITTSSTTVSTSLIFDETNDLTVTAPSQTGAARVAAFPSLGANDEITCNAATQTLSAKTLTEPVIVDTGFIKDGNGNEYLQFSQTASAVNHLTVKNAATGGAAQLIAEGTDANVTIGLISKAAGAVFIGSTSNSNVGKLEIGDLDNSASVGFTVADTVTAYNLKFPAAVGSANQILKINSIAGDTAILEFANQAAGAAAAQQTIRLTRAGSSGAGTQDSNTTMPANTIVQQILVNVTNALNNGATLQVGLAGGAANAFMDTGDNNLLNTGVYSKFVDTAIGASADEIRLTIGGTPNTGNFSVSIVYTELPNT